MRRRLYKWTEGYAPTLVERAKQDKRVAAAIRRPSDRSDGSVVGLDLSMRGTAACALPLRWDYDLRHVQMLRAGRALGATASALERAERIAQISHDIVVFCLNVRAKYVAVEDYAYGMGGQHTTQVHELGGVVKHEVLEMFHFAVEPIVSSSARKLLLQRLPGSRGQKKGFLKEFVVRNVKRLGKIAEDWTDDECDAFVVANAALDRAGVVPLSFLGT